MVKNKLSINYPLPSDIDLFLESKIFPEMKINELNDDNISEISEYIFQEYETPLSEGKLSKEQKELLRIAAKTVTFLTAEPVRNL
jgi:hypothetical protein